MEDLRELRAGLEPVQRALGGELLSSSVILTPDRMRQALAKDPWEVLMDVRPLAFFNASIPREGVPVRFEHDGVAYLGWQMRGALPMLFDCAVHHPTVEHTPRKGLLGRLFDSAKPPQAERDSGSPGIITPPPSVAALHSFRDPLKDGGEGPELVILPSGRFQMGSTEHASEQPIREVRVDSTLAVGKYPVTFEAYDRFCQATGSRKPEDQGWGRGERPVINVDWHEAHEYCDWLALQTGRDYRLPSEAEWEYACRAGTRTRFSFGDNENELGRFAWFSGNSQGKTQPVGRKRPNPWGLHDTQGNVWEWCRDQWHENYQKAPTDGSAWETGGNSKYRVLRGGSWGSDPIRCRPADRAGDDPDARSNDIGFRVVCLVAARTL